MDGLEKYVVLEKEVGETPLATVERFRKTKSTLAGVSMTYAGRLDPMAEGKLLILIGDECKKRNAYDRLDKEYEFEILLGIKSDTGDILGLVETVVGDVTVSDKRILEVIKTVVGTHVVPYPIFSSKTVHGKPLFAYVHDNTIGEIDIPTQRSTVYRIVYCGQRTCSAPEVVEQVRKKINKVVTNPQDSRPGSDFRKNEVLARWQEKYSARQNYVVLTFRVVVGSGTYVRTLASCIAEKLGTVGLAYSIKRTKIGRYLAITRKLGFWRSTF